MKIAVMQPYFFPYIGYFQLVGQVDKFIFLDDVNYINRGWVNRNRIIVNGSEHLFTLPLRKASQNRKINEIKLFEFKAWRNTFMRTLEAAYKNSPYFDGVYGFIDAMLSREYEYLSDINERTIIGIVEKLGISAEFGYSSRDHSDCTATGQQRIIDICKKENADIYVNLPGGRDLYDEAIFENNGIKLLFINKNITPYKQKSAYFHDGMSIIDIMMCCAPEKIKSEFELTGESYE